MISEKELYKTQAEWALNHTRYPDVIWAEDLFDITLVPYQGSIRKLPHYADMKDRLELYGLIVVMHTIQEVRILECRADVEKNRLYIVEGVFRKFWKEIRKSIASAMAEHGLRVNPGACLDLEFMPDPKEKRKKTQPVDTWTRRKQSLLDDPKNLFYYGGEDGLIHDRDCPEMKRIDPKDLQASAIGPEELGYCPRCAYRLYARVACAPVSKEVDAVEHLVRRHHIGISRWIHKNRRIEARDFSRERKCAAMKDANTEDIQEESALFAFLPVFAKKCYPQKYLSKTRVILTV